MVCCRIRRIEKLIKQERDSKFFLNKVVTATVIKDTQNCYFVVEKISGLQACYPKYENIELEINEEYLFYCYKVKKDTLYLKINHPAIAFYHINKINDFEDLIIKVKLYQKNRLLIFEYIYTKKKLPKEFLHKLNLIFPNERVIFKKFQ